MNVCTNVFLCLHHLVSIVLLSTLFHNQEQLPLPNPAGKLASLDKTDYSSCNQPAQYTWTMAYTHPTINAGYA
jgi:hypothetical protein